MVAKKRADSGGKLAIANSKFNQFYKYIFANEVIYTYLLNSSSVSIITLGFIGFFQTLDSRLNLTLVFRRLNQYILCQTPSNS